MGRSLSVIKRTRQSERRKLQNLEYKTRMKKARKNIKQLIENKSSQEDLLKAYSEYTSIVDKMSKKNIIHKNNAARKKSRMNGRIKKYLSN